MLASTKEKDVRAAAHSLRNVSPPANHAAPPAAEEPRNRLRVKERRRRFEEICGCCARAMASSLFGCRPNSYTRFWCRRHVVRTASDWPGLRPPAGSPQLELPPG